MKVVILFMCLALYFSSAAGQTLPATTAKISTIDIPRLFVMNEGQWDERITASSMGLGPTVSFGREGYSVGIERGASLQTGDAVVPAWPGMRLVAPSSKCSIEPTEVSGPKAKYYKDGDGHVVLQELTQYSGIAFKQAWSGIDVRVTRDASGMRHDIGVKAGADLSDFRLRFDNAKAAQLAFSGLDGVPGAKPKLEEVGGGVELSLGDTKVLKDFRVTLVYNYYLGGEQNDAVHRVHCDRAGNLRMHGYTNSPEFPRPHTANRTFTFILSVDPDNGKILHSVQFEDAYVGYWYGNNSAIGKHDNLVMTWYRSPMLTPDAEFQPVGAYHSGLMVFDRTGLLVYGSATPDSGRVGFLDMVCDSAGTVYALGVTAITPPFITPDALQPLNRGGLDALIMKFDADTYRLKYASCFGGPGNEYLHSIAVDGCGSIAIAGNTESPEYPVVNPMQPHRLGETDLVFTKFSPDLKGIDYSTFLGGTGNDYMSGWWGYQSYTPNPAFPYYFYGSGGYGWGNGSNLCFDPDGNLFFTARGVSENFPLIDTIPGSTGSGVIGRIDRTGRLDFSSHIPNYPYSGSSYHYDNHGGIAVDACGHIFLNHWLWGTQTFPLVNPLTDKGGELHSVIDPGNGEVLFSTRMGEGSGYYYGGGYGYGYGYGNNSPAVLNGTTVYFVSSAYRTINNFPVTPGFPVGQENNRTDIQIMRLEMPDLCSRPVFHDLNRRFGALTAELLPLDTLRMDRQRGIFTPDPYIVRCRVRNISTTKPSDSVVVELLLPDGTMLAPGSPPLRQVSAPLAPQGSIDLEWRLKPLVGQIADTASLRMEFRYMTGEDCPTKETIIRFSPILPVPIVSAEVYCQVTVEPSLKLNSDRTRLLKDTITIRVRIHNPSSKTAQLKSVLLSFPPDAGITLIAPPDSIVRPPAIPGNGSIDLQWKAVIQSWPFARPLPLSVLLVDTFSVVVSECSLRASVPGSSGSICTITAPDTVHFRTDDNSYIPRPIVFTVVIPNVSDTNRYYRNLRLDLGLSQYLKLESGETAQRPDFWIEEDSSAVFSWRLRVWPYPTRSTVEPVRVRYNVEADSIDRVCEKQIHIFVAAPEISCTLTVQDSLHLDASDLKFIEDSVLVTAEFRNTGSLPQPLHHARLSFAGGENVEVPGGRDKPLASVPAGGNAIATWYIRVPAYTFEQDVAMTVTAYDSAGKTITSCSDFIHAPAIVLQCGITAPDSVRYDIASGKYTPERFEVTAALHNPSDTALSNLRAILDSTMLQRAKLTASNFALQSRADLLPGETWTPRWELEATWDDRPADQRFRVLFEYSPSNASTACEIGVIIGGAPRISSLACSTAGHDSVWVDSYYEALLPDPLQVQYTLRNTGNIATPSCQLAILPPPMLLLEAGEDSIRAVPVLQPGDAYAAEWLLRIDEAKVTPEPWIIRWKTECEGLNEIPACEHGIQLMQRAPIGVVLTPWLLRFEAERDGPLPASRQVQVWTGGGLTPSWTATSVPLWLDVSPLFGAGHTVMTAVPNTTALPVGEHADRIVLSETPISTGDVQVIYSIRTPLGVDNRTRPGAPSIGSVYPNPVSAGAMLVVEYRNAAPSEIALSLHDMLGRERLVVTQRSFVDGLLSVPTQGLPAGAYVLRLRSGAAFVERLVVLR
jgi:hypothetical protein